MWFIFHSFIDKQSFLFQKLLSFPLLHEFYTTFCRRWFTHNLLYTSMMLCVNKTLFQLPIKTSVRFPISHFILFENHWQQKLISPHFNFQFNCTGIGRFGWDNTADRSMCPSKFQVIYILIPYNVHVCASFCEAQNSIYLSFLIRIHLAIGGLQ